MPDTERRLPRREGGAQDDHHGGGNVNPMLRQALAYAARGWRVLPVHSIRDGRCTCRHPGCLTPGKHPIERGWQHRATTSGADIWEWWERWPAANVGIATGLESGIFVPDIDPDKGGDATLAALIAEHGPLPATRTHRTGSGGTHYLFSHPDFPVISKTDTFGTGIDTRGAGGFIVAPPSVSGKGAYTVTDDRDPVAAPEWLLAPLRDLASRVAVGGDVPTVSGEPVDRAAIPGRLGELLKVMLTDGQGRHRHFYRIVAEGRRAGYSQGQLVTLAAAWCAMTGKFTGRVETQVAAVWGKLDAEIQGIQFSPAGEVGETVARQGSTGPQMTTLLAQLRDALIDSDTLDRLPIPEPLIDGLLYRDSLAWLHGKPGHCKSFMALDFACCIDAGLPWMQRPVTQGPVLYVIAEGATGLRPRVRAWEDRAGQKTGVRFLPVAVQMLHAGHTEAIAELAAELQCVLVVLDTQARVTVGADENSAVDMGRLVAAAEKIRVATRACVKFVHHEARAGDNMRGSTALEGAATTILRVVKDGPRLELTNPKQKDAAEADPITLWVTPRLQSVVIADQPYGPTLDLRADSENKILNTLLDMFETTGASATNLREATGLPKSTFFYALNRLVKDGLVQNLGTRTRSCYVSAQASLPGEVQQVQRGPSPVGPMSNATTKGVALDHRTPWTTGPRPGESPLGYAQRLSRERAEATP